MPRARNIKPGFFESEQVGQVPFGARLLFEALWLMADRQGRLEDRPLRFKGFAFRYDPTTVEEIELWLQQLEAVRLIDRYTVDRLMLIWIPKFKDHQNPHVKEKASTLPALALHQISTRQAPGLHQFNTEPILLNPDVLNPDSKTCASAQIADSLPPVDDAPFDPVGTSSGNTWDEQKSDTALTAKKPDLVAELFPLFWKKYLPIRNKSKAAALMAFRQKVKTREQFERIMAALERQTPELMAKAPAHRPYGSTWLNGERWEDEPDTPAMATSASAANAPDYYREFPSEDL